MASQSKRTTAPAPPEFPWPPTQPIRSPTTQSVPSPAIPSMFGPGGWLPPRPHQSMAASTQPCWFPGIHQPPMADLPAQGPWWTSPDSSQPTPGSVDDHNLQAWGLDSHPPGGFLSYFKNTSSHTQGTSSQPINVGDATNGDDCGRTEKRLPWTEEEDLRLVSAWLNNSNDPIQSNYKKNDQYWKDVAAVYNTPSLKMI